MSFARRFVCFLSINMSLVAAPSSGTSIIRPAAADEHWTVEKALQRALESNPDFLASKAEFERQQGVRMQVRAKMLPQLSLVASADERAKSLIDRSPGELEAASRPIQPTPLTAVAATSYDARVQLQQLIFDGLDTWHQNRRYKSLVEQARYMMEATAHQTVALVRQSFDAVLWRRRALEAERQRVTALEQVVNWTEKKQQVGEIADYENFRAQAELKLAEAAMTQALSDVAKAEQTFRRILMIPDGASKGSALLLEGELAPRKLGFTYEEAVAMAHSRRPDLSAALASLKAAQFGVRAAYGGYLPRVELTAGYGARSSYFDASRRLDGWTGGIAARWDIFDGLQNRGRLRSELATRRAAQIRVEELRLQIDSQLRELYAGLDLARSSVEAQRVAADLGRRSLAQARRLQELGQASLEQVLQAELTSRQAELGLLEAIFNHNATISQIEYSMGDGFSPLDSEAR